MNKKGFTLIIGALMLAGTWGTGSAQITVTRGTDAPDLSAGSSERLYQLWAETVGGVPDLLLNVDERGFLYVCPASAYPETFGSSLWCIQSYVPNESGNTRFDFTSKTQGYTLAVSENDAVPLPLGDSAVNVLKGNLMGWGFSLLANPLQKQRALYTQFSTDSVLALTATYNSAGKYYVKAKKFARTDVESGGKAYNDPDVLKFTIVQPAPHVLKAYDFNTLLVSPVELFRKLTFSNTTPSGVGSPWSDNALWATDDTAHFVNDHLGWVRFNLNTTSETNKYLRVDTSYVPGTKSLAFKFDVHPDFTTLPNQYLFRLMYDVFNDSLAIDVAQAIFPKGDKYFSETVPTTWEGGYSTIPETIKKDADFLHVKLQDSVITIGESPVSTKAMFNIKGCGAPIGEGDGLDSKDNGLYTIRNSAGQYLGVPVYTDTIAPKWLTLQENVEPNRIPAYQWVVVKTKGADPDSISPIEIYNREFPEQIYTQRIQLFKDQAANLFGDNAYNFTPVRAAEMSDPYLGYKYVDASSSKFNVYEFNFLHDFNDTRFLTATIQRADTLLCIGTTSTGRSQFQLIHQGDKVYGYYNGYKGLPEIIGLATLKRAAYIIRVNDIDGEPYADKYIALGQEDRYVAKDAVGNASVFLLKTNNTKADVDYYALLEINSDAKLGIDDDLWAYVQKQKDTRTSAFSLASLPVETGPLYRRFDGGEYGYSPVKEPFGNAANTPQWLKFTKQSNSGKEFLFENSPSGKGNALGTENDYRQDIKNKSISFLGLYDKDKHPETSGFGYTFYVDTAYVRGNTQKPQYMLAVRPVIQPAFVRGYYVFNAQDSIGRMDEDNYYLNDYVGKFDYGAEYTTRLAFVDGVHLADTFYVLREKIATEEITLSYLAKISMGDKIYLGDNTHYKPRWNRNRTIDGAAYNGTVFNDEYNGKSMVFQFRLVDPDENDRRFLIESRQEDSEMAPETGRWMKIRNGVPIISGAITWTEATQNNGADIFNVIGGDQGQAVAGESVVTTGVKVISAVGTVTILNAAGKTVAISNILGQTVTGAIIASDNVTIPLPKGIVIVAIKGEPAVKAIVK